MDTIGAAAGAWLNRESTAPSPIRPGDRRGLAAGSAAQSWLYDGATFSIRYQPAGHADPVLAAWLTLLAGAADAQKRPLVVAMLKELAQPTSPGLCASCHSIDEAENGERVIHWRGAEYAGSATSRLTARPFTKFTHGPHLLLSELADCATCHAIDPASERTTPYANGNARSFVSEFQPMTRQACATCHTAKAAGDRCQSCHNYHVDGAETRRTSARSPLHN
jgi:hypothetical protein